MKKLNYLLLTLFLFAGCQNNSKDVKETKIEDTKKTVTVALKDSYEKLQTVSEKEDYLLLSEQFKLANSSETKEWIPKYYASYCLINAAYLEENNEVKDELLDKAQLLLDDCFNMDPKESEFHVLQAFLYYTAIMVDPPLRARTLGDKAKTILEDALKLNENNPRIYFFLGANTMRRPAEYGGGPEKALPLLETAKEKFNSFESDILYYPHWGEDLNNLYLKKCKM